MISAIISRGRKLLRSAFVSNAGTLRPLGHLLPQSAREGLLFQSFVAKWFRDDGDARHRLEYPDLDAHSVVFDLGGYKGQFASDIFAKYGCRVCVFEPFSSYFRIIQARFRANDRIEVFGFALGGSDGVATIYAGGDGTSIYRASTISEEIEIRRFSRFFEDRGLERVELLKINIEGAEFDLLEGMIRDGLHKKIRNIQVQFHRDIAGARERRARIKAHLLKTHRLTYEYPFVWENYQLMPNDGPAGAP